MSENSIPAVRPMSTAAVEKKALDIVTEFSPSTLTAEVPFPIFHFCEFSLEDITGIVFGVEELPPDIEGKFEGESLIVNSNVYHRAQNNDGRARFTLAHELEHCLLHANELRQMNHPTRSIVQLHRRKSIPAYRNPEWQANTFASSLLMPQEAIDTIVDEKRMCLDHSRFLFPLSWDIAHRLQVSNQAAQIRLEKLGIN